MHCRSLQCAIPGISRPIPLDFDQSVGGITILLNLEDHQKPDPIDRLKASTVANKDIILSSLGFFNPMHKPVLQWPHRPESSLRILSRSHPSSIPRKGLQQDQVGRCTTFPSLAHDSEEFIRNTSWGIDSFSLASRSDWHWVSPNNPRRSFPKQRKREVPSSGHTINDDLLIIRSINYFP